MSTIFTKIINREIPSCIIAEDENFIAFLDAMPLVKGHTLVVPKKETDLIFDLESEEYKNLWGFTQEIAKKIKNAVPCVRVGVAVVGLEVPHAHIHLIPLNTVEDMNFKNTRLKLTDEEYKEIQKSIINS
ncbi:MULTISPECIES: HIT family protein [Chryseobacterium]|uniref:Histidine triad (HIT) family protein n=1 Tax=Chryseobacterium camelliae TaxID=1265445 RepID=A0ABU0TP12_9FLAO|nr:MULTISPECIES: HIT family protein [Chryseobacterium]MDT3407379.1 histidine triad (HIT) family protein [Pseudacidovorax intermedius]MDQ1098772.1 histidine triad (HIT) family protein [Chryseobacterium camelliae]MDQ1102696.1 histidine triad (HIT) family protein [Chryseobacterium sp. SORGH_AS_1048]MDR6086125.1 histidine triad (HIT) family protein [Chryseobacterium sp. SORGH_AS_0909]MDR6130495.1 histidine triad (HIT) family protein [Chryseobacterium sp. SORGH_AS_1175]